MHYRSWLWWAPSALRFLGLRCHISPGDLWLVKEPEAVLSMNINQQYMGPLFLASLFKQIYYLLIRFIFLVLFSRQGLYMAQVVLELAVIASISTELRLWALNHHTHLHAIAFKIYSVYLGLFIRGCAFMCMYTCMGLCVHVCMCMCLCVHPFWNCRGHRCPAVSALSGPDLETRCLTELS